VFAAVGELLETVFFGEIFDLYVFGGLPTLGFEFSYFPDFLLDLFAQGGGFLDVLLSDLTKTPGNLKSNRRFKSLLYLI
jgi:hypothetical protein